VLECYSARLWISNVIRRTAFHEKTWCGDSRPRLSVWDRVSDPVVERSSTAFRTRMASPRIIRLPPQSLVIAKYLGEPSCPFQDE
jgi:hypothetical protein